MPKGGARSTRCSIERWWGERWRSYPFRPLRGVANPGHRRQGMATAGPAPPEPAHRVSAKALCVVTAAAAGVLLCCASYFFVMVLVVLVDTYDASDCLM